MLQEWPHQAGHDFEKTAVVFNCFGHVDGCALLVRNDLCLDLPDEWVKLTQCQRLDDEWVRGRCRV